MTWFIVLVGREEVARTESYDEAVYWMHLHNRMVVNGRFASIVERG